MIIVAENEDEVVTFGDAGGEFFGWLRLAVFGFKGLFGAGFIIGECVEGVFLSVFALGGVVDTNIVIAFFFHGCLFGTGEAGGFGAV